jgi:pimeloyl-ACP methyl ester carboxylesterase
MDTPIPLAFHLTKWLLRWPAIAKKMSQSARENLEGAASRSIPDPALRARTLQDPEIGPLFTELLTSTSDRMAQRLPGTENDIAITRRTDYPLEQIAVPALIVHGTADRVVPYTPHAHALSTRIPGADLLTVDGGEHVAIFTHNQQVKPRVAAFLRTVSEL